jgi:hypothetical protein
MIRPQHGTELLHVLLRSFDALLVEGVAEDVHAVGAGEVVTAIAVEIGEGDSAGRLNERTCIEVLAHEMTELERHAIGVDELQIGDAFGDLCSASDRLRKSCSVELRQPHESGAAERRNLFRRIIASKELRLVILIERHKGRDPPCDPGMPGQRPMLRLRELQSRLQFRQGGGQRGRADRVQGKSCGPDLHQIVTYPNRFTAR